MIKPTPVALFISALLPCLGAVAAEPPEIPFEFADGFIRVQVEVPVSSTPLNMLLDSGASVSVLNITTAQRLNVPMGDPLSIRGVASDASAYEIAPLPAAMSGVEAGAITLVADMSHANSLCAEPIDGLIGVDFFRDRVVQIDYTKRCLRLLPRPPKAKGALRLPVKLINDVACVAVGVNGSSARWTRLDTGCNDSLHWVIPKHNRDKKPRTASIGFVTDANDIAPASVSLGSRIMDSVPTALHGRAFFDGEAGLLGNGLLSRFKVTLDWPGQSLILEKR